MLDLIGALKRYALRLWRLPEHLRGLFGASAATTQRGAMESRLETRARYWKAVREGQREAEARCAERENGKVE